MGLPKRRGQWHGQDAAIGGMGFGGAGGGIDSGDQNGDWRLTVLHPL